MHAQRLKTWFRSTMTQERFTNLTIFNSHKERTNKRTRSLVNLANESSDRNDNRRRNFGIFKENNIRLCLSFLMGYTDLLFSILIDAPFCTSLSVECSRSKLVGFLVASSTTTVNHISTYLYLRISLINFNCISQHLRGV